MKILHIIESSRFSGPISTILFLSRIDPKSNFILSSTEDNDKLNKQAEVIGVTTYFKDLTRSRLQLNIILRYIVRFPKEIRIIQKVIMDVNPDIVHVHTYTDIKGVIAAKLLKRKCLWHIHIDKPKSFYRPIFKLISNWASPYFTFVSESAKKNFSFVSGLDHSWVIQSAIDIDKFLPKIDFLKGPLRVRAVGNYQERKGFGLIVEIAKECQARKLNVEFEILGRVFDTQGDYYKRLKRETLGLNNIRLLTDDSMGVNNFMRGGDLLIMSSHEEASPFVVWEAASSGLAILSTDVGDVSTFVNRYECGKIHTSRHHEQFVEDIEIFIENPEILSDMQSNARTMAEEVFSSAVISKQYESLYHKIMS